jgi:hypothetical protein
MAPSLARTVPARISPLAPPHVRYTTLRRRRIPGTFRCLGAFGSGIENPRVGGSIPSLDKAPMIAAAAERVRRPP